MKAAVGNRHGHRDATMVFLTYRHGLRASELCALRWEQLDMVHGLLHVARVKNGMPSVHPLTGKELRALRRLQREQEPGGLSLPTTGSHDHCAQAINEVTTGRVEGGPHLLRCAGELERPRSEFPTGAVGTPLRCSHSTRSVTRCGRQGSAQLDDRRSVTTPFKLKPAEHRLSSPEVCVENQDQGAKPPVRGAGAGLKRQIGSASEILCPPSNRSIVIARGLRRFPCEIEIFSLMLPSPPQWSVCLL